MNLNQQSRTQPVRRNTGGIVIMLGAPAQRSLPVESAMPVIEMKTTDIPQ